MGCKCTERNQRDTARVHIAQPKKIKTINKDQQDKLLKMNVGTSPIEGCLFCAEKHLSTAAALARELGYIPINRGYVIGEIVAACWHLNGTKIPNAIALADKLRDFRHQIQGRTDDKSCINFDQYLKEINDLIEENLKNEH